MAKPLSCPLEYYHTLMITKLKAINDYNTVDLPINNVYIIMSLLGFMGKPIGFICEHVFN